MAGMLPGVEAARRRRFHQKSNLITNHYGSDLTTNSSTRRSSFCLYASSHEFHLSSASSNSMRNNPMREELYDETRLGVEAREAKKRLDERLQPQRRTQTNRSNTNNEQRLMMRSSLQHMPTSIPADQQQASLEGPNKLKRSGSKRLMKWLKVSWKSSEQEECAVCLEQLKSQTQTQLACGHRFHTNCLVPWLETNSHCPCCRMEISTS